MESTSTVFGLSFKKNPRAGQKEVFRRVAQDCPKLLNIRLPTGYGKTFVGVGSYAIRRGQGRSNRLLVVFTSDAQLEQFKQGGVGDFADVGAHDVKSIVDIRFSGTRALKKHRHNDAEVFVTTVQAMLGVGGEIVHELFGAGGRWMVLVDEYHHYGIDAAWGKAVLALPADFVLAMSATPSRKANDSAFGAPDISVRYRDAVDEDAVKPLRGHSYVYRIDLLDEQGGVESLTTDELFEAAGASAPDKVDRWAINRKMRWSPKYVSPLVSVPLERMIRERIATGYRLQAIVGAMCVSHAEMVCKQIETMFPDLSVDWVGTGDNGRKPDENRKVLRGFCPPKDERGRRNHTLDVLVHVGMAGEGLDSVEVSEVIHLNAANWNNSNDQENGRAARYLPGVTGHINFDSTSEYARLGYLGRNIMDAFDGEPPRGDLGPEPVDRDLGEYSELPEEPAILIHNMELDHIDSGDPEVVRMKKVLAGMVNGVSLDDLNNPDHPIHAAALAEYRRMRHAEAEQIDEESTIRQWQESVRGAASAVTGLAIRKIYPEQRIERTVAGDIKKRINTRKMRALGRIDKDVEICRKHYLWLKGLEQQLVKGDVPSWLR